MGSFDNEAERMHFESVVGAFKKYREHSLNRIEKSLTFIKDLPKSHQKRLIKYQDYLKQFKSAVDVNDKIIQGIITDVETMFENVSPTNGMQSEGDSNESRHSDDIMHEPMAKSRPWHQDYEKVQSVLKQLVRDWSSLGEGERNQCYKPIIDEIIEQFRPDSSDTSHIKVLVPGAGLGRLAWEIATKGFTCQGNEFSLFMLFASNFVINKCTQINQYELHPWLHQYVNNLSCTHQLAVASIPDVPPSALLHKNFSMAAGDFLKVYSEENIWHCVATCFFIDCAPNVIAFIETIYNILKPGGVWINLGPLLYHYSDLPTEDSIEPPFDILMDIIKDVGFQVEKSSQGVKTKYAQNPNSMLQYEYDSVFFVCRKPPEVM